MTEDRIHAPTFERNDDRGRFTEILNEGPWQTVIHGTMVAGAELGEHYHKECRAYFYLLSGKVEIAVVHLAEGNRRSDVVLGPGQGIFFLPFETHRVRFVEEGAFILLKSYRYDPERPDIYPHPVDDLDRV